MFMCPDKQIPLCHICGKEYVNTVDSRTKKLSKYLWKRACNCEKNDYVLSVG